MAGDRVAHLAPPAPKPAARRRQGQGAKAATGPVWWQDYLASAQKPYLADELAQANQALEKLSQQVASDRSEKLTADVEEIHEYLSSPLPRLHGLGARRMQGITDEYLGELQRAWRTRYGEDLIGFIAGRLRRGASPGLRRASELLRAGFARNPSLQKEFIAAYAEKRLVGEYAWRVHEGFSPGAELRAQNATQTQNSRKANADEKTGLAALQNQPAVLLKAIDAAFRHSYGDGMEDWLTREVPRSEAFVKAVAILRHGSVRPEVVEQHLYVDLAALLIPPKVSSPDAVLAVLRGLKHPERRKLQADFDRSFEGIGPYPGSNSPDTLAGYIGMKLAAIRDLAPLHEALALLHHNPSEAENIYFQVPRWGLAHPEAAIKILTHLVKTGASWQKLNADWETFVRGGLAGSTTGFTDESMREHLKSVLTFSDEKRVLALLDALDYQGGSAQKASVPGEPAAVSLSAESLADEDAQAHKTEESRLVAARASIRASEGSVFSEDRAILDALRSINTLYAERVARLNGLAERAKLSTSSDGLALQARQQLSDHYANLAFGAISAGAQEKRRLSHDLAGHKIKMSSGQYALARALLTVEPSVADEVYVALENREYEQLVELVTATWRRRGIDALHRDAARAAKDENGDEVRPKFNLYQKVIGDFGFASTLPAKRVLALIGGGISDARRGATRLLLEIDQGDSDAVLGEVASLLTAPDLDRKLRDEVVRGLADALQPGHAGSNPATQLLVWLEEHFQGRTDRWLQLQAALDPARTPQEHALRARERKVAGQRGALSGVVSGAADAWDWASGQNLADSVGRSQQRLEFIATASQEQLAPLLDAVGVKTREELAQYEHDIFDTRQGSRRAIENSAAQLVAGMVETLAEAGLSVLTGGAGAVAVMNAMAASIISMCATKAMLGPEYELISADNLNTVIQSGLGTALVELDLRKQIVDRVKLDSVKSQFGRDWVHNTLTGAAEALITSGSDLASNLLLRDKWPSNEDLARHADMALGRLIAKSHSTFVTVKYNPGNYKAYMPFAERLKTNVLFKLSLKLTEGGAKEIVSILFNGKSDKTFSENFLQVLWKEARGAVSSSTKALASAKGGASTVDNEKAHIERYQARSPHAFAHSVRQLLRGRYDDPEKGAALRQEHEAAVAGGAKVSIEQFMLQKLVQDDGLKSKLHKDILDHASGYLGEEPGKGLLGRDGSTPKAIHELAAPATPQAEALRQKRELGLGFDIRRTGVALDAFVRDKALPPGVDAKTFKARWLARVREHANSDPENLSQRVRLMSEVLESRGSFVQGLIVGEPKVLRQFIQAHGHWQQAVELLEMGGPALRQIAQNLVRERNQLVAEVGARFGARLAATASTHAISDLDFSTIGRDAGQRMLEAEQAMQRDYGPHWHAVWRMRFYTDPNYLTHYVGEFRGASAEDRAAIQTRLTVATERYGFAKMLQATGGNPALQQWVKHLAGELGHDLGPSTADAKLDKATIESRRTRRVHEIDQLQREYHGLPGDPRLGLKDETQATGVGQPRRRLQLAERIASLQIEVNFLSEEANVGAGANRALINRARVVGPEAYQAAFSHTTAFIEHRAVPGSERQYEPYKYIGRIVEMLRALGESGPELDHFAKLANDVNKLDRNRLHKGMQPGTRTGAGDPATAAAPLKRELDQQLDGLQAMVVVALKRRRAEVFAQPERWFDGEVASGQIDQPRQAAGPISPRRQATVEVNSHYQAGLTDLGLTAPTRGSVRGVVIASDYRAALQASGSLQAPLPPPGFSGLAAFGAAIRWGSGEQAPRERARAITLAEVKALGLGRDLAQQWRDFYIAQSRRAPIDDSAAGNATAPARAELMQRILDLYDGQH